MNLPEQYVVNIFYKYAGSPRYNRLTKNYQGSCPICREGKSWLKKQRLYYIVKSQRLFCHNCGWSGTPYRWIRDVSGMSREEILANSREFDDTFVEKTETNKHFVTPTLPGDCINLYDKAQIDFYKDNKDIQRAVKYLHDRRIFTATNRPPSIYYCRNDFTHHDRIVIPFFDAQEKIIFYQTRSISPTDPRPKYLGKIDGEKSLFNINNITPDLDCVFVLEGPFNAFFVKNSVAVGGIQDNSNTLFAPRQKQQIKLLEKFYKIIWVLDSQWIDSAGYRKTKILIEQKQNVFIWPRAIGLRYKDFNDMCVDLSVDHVQPQFIIDNTYNSAEAEIVLSQIPRK